MFVRSSAIFGLVISLLVGVPLGTAFATFFYADGLAYLSKDPRACINCHVMQGQFNSWQASSHHTVATCNDCHSNGSFIEKYAQKGLNGFLHSWAFTTGLYHDPIRIKQFNLSITKRTCLSCHSELVESSRWSHPSWEEKDCLSCHREVGHRK